MSWTCLRSTARRPAKLLQSKWRWRWSVALHTQHSRTHGDSFSRRCGSPVSFHHLCPRYDRLTMLFLAVTVVAGGGGCSGRGGPPAGQQTGAVGHGGRSRPIRSTSRPRQRCVPCSSELTQPRALYAHVYWGASGLPTIGTHKLRRIPLLVPTSHPHHNVTSCPCSLNGHVRLTVSVPVRAVGTRRYRGAAGSASATRQ